MSLAMSGLTEKIPSQTPGVVAAHQTMMSIQRINSTLVHGECDRKETEAIMEIRIQQTW
jgi:hypothetical protein